MRKVAILGQLCEIATSQNIRSPDKGMTKLQKLGEEWTQNYGLYTGCDIHIILNLILVLEFVPLHYEFIPGSIDKTEIHWHWAGHRSIEQTDLKISNDERF